jgi:prephenate dehydrogenase
MWADICVANRDALLAMLEDYENELEITRAAIASADVAELRRLFSKARDARGKWLLGRRT